jgi:hypothetical protein
MRCGVRKEDMGTEKPGYETETGYGDKIGDMETEKEIWRQRRIYGDRGGDREVRYGDRWFMGSGQGRWGQIRDAGSEMGYGT